MQKLLRVVIVMAVAFVAIIGVRWYIYVAHGESPYDEVGISLNNYMPGPVHLWGCRTMQKRFEGQLPPYGCAAPDGNGWM